MASCAIGAALAIAHGLALVVLIGLPAHANELTRAAAPLPTKLTDTDLYVPGSESVVRPGNLPFSPQYPLWSDGATKRRWLHIPPGTFIDGSRPDAWEFPPGTKVWKEFTHGRRIETRLIERLHDGTWRYATYIWNEEGTQALLAPAEGIPTLPVTTAPHGRYVIPAEFDCRACHESAAVPVLGVSALQLSPDRDPLAPHAEPLRPGDTDLQALVARGWLRNLPATSGDRAPRIAAPSPESRAALGYLHGNCGHCHNDNGSPAPVDLVLARRTVDDISYESILRSLVGVPARYRPHGMRAGAPLLDASRPETSVLAARMRSRNALAQMPPLGTQLVDNESLDLIERWIRQLPPKEANR
jgi:hypothetical protein